MNLKIHPRGIVDFHDGPRNYTPIDLVQEACGLRNDFSRAFGLLSDWLGRVPDSDFIQFDRKIDIVDGDRIDIETGEILEDESGAEEPKGNDYSDAILARPSLVSTIANWILSISRRPQKRLAVASALAVVGTAASRQFATPTHSNLNLYLLMVVPTGMGKDAPMKGAASLLAKAGLPELLGPDGFSSDVAIYDELFHKPTCLSAMDEFGTFLSAITARNAPSLAQRIMSAMRKFYDGGVMRAPHAISRPGVVLFNPCLSILAASTPGQFFGAVSGAQAEDGFLNRFVAIMGHGDVEKHAPKTSISDAPQYITDALLEVANLPGGLVSSRYRLPMSPGDMNNLEPQNVAWTEEAQARWESFDDEIMARLKLTLDTSAGRLMPCSIYCRITRLPPLPSRPD